MKNATQYIRGDKVIWIVLIILTLISLVEVYSSIGKFAYDKDVSTLSLFIKHFVIIVFTYICIILISRIDYRKFARLSQIGYYISIVLLVVTMGLFFFGRISGKAAGRWLEIPGLGQFQPSEIAKFILIVYIARLLTKSKDTIKEWSTFKKILLPIIIIAALIFPQNFSTAALLFVVCFIMMFVGNINYKYWFSAAGIGIVALCIGFTVMTHVERAKQDANIQQKGAEVIRSSTWLNRIDEWRSNDKDEDTQTNTAKKAIATGGFMGKHPGNTVQGRLLSESHNDFIYAIVIEELGMFIGIIILFLYSILFFRCIIIAKRCQGSFGALTVSGLGLLIYLQALINMGVAVGYLPVTGQTLPFISYGGTSYLLSGCAIGIIQSISSASLQENQPKENIQDEVIEESIENQIISK